MKRNRHQPVFAGPIVLPAGLAQSKRRFVARATGTAFNFQAAGTVAEIDLYDEIGYWGVTAADFKRQLRGITAETIRLNINSPGGDVFDGIAMYNDLLDHPATIEVHVTGLAASAASLIAMAGDRIVMAANAFLMIHNAWGLSIGDRNDMQAFAEVLQQIDTALAETYAARSGKEASEIAGLMDAETWLGGAAAVEEGFADALADGDGENRAAASFDLSRFKNLPAALRGARADPRAPAEPIVIAAEERAALEGLIKAIVS